MSAVFCRVSSSLFIDYSGELKYSEKAKCFLSLFLVPFNSEIDRFTEQFIATFFQRYLSMATKLSAPLFRFSLPCVLLITIALRDA